MTPELVQLAPACGALWKLDAGALASGYASGALSPVDVMRNVLERLDDANPRINAVIARDDDAAMAAATASAARWAQGAPLSPLDGVPISVKDNIPVQGLICTWGSRLFAQHAPRSDESPASRLRRAGALLFAKTNVPEFTLQGYTDNVLFGTTRNPWHLLSTPGGSSGGAVAAVAAGIGPAALATDGGGSIRRPCGFTGLVGLKPGRGTVPRADGLPAMLPGLEEIGPVARTVGDVVRILQVLAPAMRFDPAQILPNPAPRWSVVHWRAIAGGPVDAEITARVDAVASQLRAMGHRVTQAEAPASVEAFNRKAWPVLSATGLASVMAPHAGREHLLGPAMAMLLETGRRLSAIDLFEAQSLQRAMEADMAQLFMHHDVILTPSSAAMPWPAQESHPQAIAGEAVDARGHAVFTAFVNGAGLPAVSLPAEPPASGMPVGFQLVGAPGAEALLCALALAFEARHPWAHRRPQEPVST